MSKRSDRKEQQLSLALYAEVPRLEVREPIVFGTRDPMEYWLQLEEFERFARCGPEHSAGE